MQASDVLTFFFSYIITDYERSNFSVSQCRFEDGVPAQLVPIRSATETPNHSSRNVLLGTIIGSAALLLLLIIASIFVIRKKRRHTRQQVDVRLNQNTTGHQGPLQDPRPSIISSAREIDDNSNTGQIREIPDTGVAELLDELLHEMSPSGPGHETSRSSRILPQVSHELRTHRSSQVMVRTRTYSKGPLCRLKEVPRTRCKEIVTSDDASTIQMVLALSAQHIDHVDQDDASVVTSNLEAQIYSSYMRKPLDLNRTLPPTPISETPQSSPAVADF